MQKQREKLMKDHNWKKDTKQWLNDDDDDDDDDGDEDLSNAQQKI